MALPGHYAYPELQRNTDKKNESTTRHTNTADRIETVKMTKYTYGT